MLLLLKYTWKGFRFLCLLFFFGWSRIIMFHKVPLYFRILNCRKKGFFFCSRHQWYHYPAIPLISFFYAQGILSTAKGLNALQSLDSLDRSLLMVCMNCCISFVLLIAFFSFNLASAPKLLHM